MNFVGENGWKIKLSRTLKFTGRSNFERERGGKCKILKICTKMLRIKIIKVIVEHNTMSF